MLAGAAVSSPPLIPLTSLRSTAPWRSELLLKTLNPFISSPRAPHLWPNFKYSSYLCLRSKLSSQDLWEDPRAEFELEADEDDGDEEGQAHHDIMTSTTTAGSEYDELVKEVELLLEPDEKAILQLNEAPVLTKISTMKWSLLHSLTLSGQIPLMDKLLERGTDIDIIDKDGFTALHKAVIGKKEALISHLLRKGANPHVRDQDGATPLHHAVQVGALQTVKLLIKYKVDVNVADKDGWTPLHVAIQSRSREIAKVLLVNGADKTRKTKHGKTPLDLCLCYGRDFKSYELAKLVKLVPADRAL